MQLFEKNDIYEKIRKKLNLKSNNATCTNTRQKIVKSKQQAPEHGSGF